jgi:hypothetical protein
MGGLDRHELHPHQVILVEAEQRTRLVRGALQAGSPQRGGEDGDRLRRELPQRSPIMFDRAQVDLGHSVQADASGHVDEQRKFDTPPEGCNYSDHISEQHVWLWPEGSNRPGIQSSLPKRPCYLAALQSPGMARES